MNAPLHTPSPATSITTPNSHAWVWRATWIGLACLLLWDASGLDMALMRVVGTPTGFALTHNFWMSTVLHTGARNASVVLFLTMWVLALAWPHGPHPQLGARRQRVWLLTGVTLSLLLISGLKALSTVSCPWDLAEFGGVAQYVSHWQFGQAQGGGRCFPGGHASSAFAYLALLPPLLLASSSRTRRQARMALFGVLVAGLLLGLVQTLRGAHFPSHNLWTGWLCWTAAWLWFALGQWISAQRQARLQRKSLPTQP